MRQHSVNLISKVMISASLDTGGGVVEGVLEAERWSTCLSTGAPLMGEACHQLHIWPHFFLPDW